MPAKGPSPTAIKKMRITTKPGITLSMDSSVLIVVLMAKFGLVLCAAKKARNMAADPPSKVPRNAMEMVWRIDPNIWLLSKSKEKFGGTISRNKANK
jgi:hypothetical protein